MRSPWLVSPTFDLIFVANLVWPLALIPVLGDGPSAPLRLWQLYFVTTPHRWITLLLVVADPDRRAGRNGLFLGIALFFAALIAAVGRFTGGLACLILLDLVWNAWHFGSQHAGILRMYSRKVGGGWEWLERHGLRIFVCYVGLRVPFSLVELPLSVAEFARWIPFADGAALVIPAMLVFTNLGAGLRERLAKNCYLLSVVVLYSAILLAVRFSPLLVVPLALASALFHATEYLAIVTHYAWRRRDIGSGGLFRTMALHWITVLLVFAAGLGLFAATAGSRWAEVWLVLNLLAAFLHYTYDGLIWKLRRTETATALGVQTG